MRQTLSIQEFVSAFRASGSTFVRIMNVKCFDGTRSNFLMFYLDERFDYIGD